MTTAILAWGNPSRGDDALAPLVCRRLEAWLGERPDAAGFEIFEDFQLQIEHALDLVGCQRVLFIDALQAGDAAAGSAFEFRRLCARRDASHSTHALSPEAVLAVFEQIHGAPAPAAYLLAIRGESFELGAPLSARASANLEAAWDFLRRLLTGTADWSVGAGSASAVQR